jgi:hypothetical protein
MTEQGITQMDEEEEEELGSTMLLAEDEQSGPSLGFILGQALQWAPLQ